MSKHEAQELMHTSIKPETNWLQLTNVYLARAASVHGAIGLSQAEKERAMLHHCRRAEACIVLAGK
mgnify:CR=1 FL=1